MLSQEQRMEIVTLVRRKLHRNIVDKFEGIDGNYGRILIEYNPQEYPALRNECLEISFSQSGYLILATAMFEAACFTDVKNFMALSASAGEGSEHV